jgi:hypothetical protein
VVNVKTTTAAFLTINVFAISGGHLSSPFDPNAAFPSGSNNSSVSAACTTSNANDILVGGVLTISAGVSGSWSSSKYPPAEPGALGMGPLEAAVGVADAAQLV